MKILLVDDNEISLELQKLMLESCGLTVDTAMSGEEAVELARQGEYGLIFMDVNMPGMDGFCASERIREFNDSVRIIALSADEIAENNEKFKASGMNSSIIKPLDRRTLQGILSDQEPALAKEKSSGRRRKDVIFDFEALSESLSSNGEVLHILRQFLDLHHQDCDMVKDFVKKKDFLSARKILHNIIGISGNMCCVRLYNISVKLSGQLQGEHSDCLDEFESVWKSTVGELSECCGRLLVMCRPQESSGDLKTVWNDFMNACDDFDVTAARIFYDNREEFEKHLSHEDYELLRQAVTQYDFILITDNKERFNVQRAVG